jgi:hypothetical protein
MRQSLEVVLNLYGLLSESQAKVLYDWEQSKKKGTKPSHFPFAVARPSSYL